MGDPELVEERQGAPRRGYELVVQAFRREGGELLRLPAKHEQRVVVEGRGRGYDLLHGKTGVAGEERDECLVLRGFEAPHADRPRAAPVPHAPPQPGQELRVGGVATVQLDEERASLVVDAAEVKHAGHLTLGFGELAHVYAQLAERRPDLWQAGAAQ